MAEADTNRETELKLAARPEDLETLRAAPSIAARATAPAVTRTLESTYYDTEDGRLADRRVTLRVRRTGDGFVQTVKSAPDGDGLGRGEWECAVTAAEPDLTLITDGEALDLLGPLTESELRPVFTSVVERTSLDVAFGEGDGASSIEIAFDRGEVRLPGGGATTPLSEVELELKSGSPAALYDLALELAKLAPLRLEIRTKAARGYALAAGGADAAVKADKLRLDSDTTVEGAVGRIMRACLAHLAANEAATLNGDDPEGVHQMRVALRRLRSAIALFRPFVPGPQYLWLVGEIKWLAGSLGPARDWDVFATELLAPVRDAFHRADGHGRSAVEDIDALAAAAEARRLRAYETVRAAIGSERYTAFLLGLGAWVEKRGWRDQPVSEDSVRLFGPVTGLADHLLEKRHKKARRAGHGFAHLPVAQRHQLRIALKKLRYAAEFFRSLYDDKPVRRYLQELAGFQDALGHLNDVATATRLLHELHEDGSRSAPGEPRAAGIVIGWHARGVSDGEADLVARWHDFLDTKRFWSKHDGVV
ncbi:CYTH and CHAD domain-containing protein [Azospirillum agricola]|uniref:CYTH and CHAD domain-containing protein n=1 Tax=Azospirillum agricola TaxID=1720247 RepID=UPI000A0F33DE|nr:CYTH and CHAD domain-containing protein [Azospirillum agricola]SMH52652.1 Inorganic triphosphatase YgiF, contains CYTH and CHAD domains [Azospirillum lipoferum]